jgi:hypothetical protein
VLVTSAATKLPVHEADDLGEGAVELVQATSVSVMTTVATAASLRTTIIVS